MNYLLHTGQISNLNNYYKSFVLLFWSRQDGYYSYWPAKVTSHAVFITLLIWCERLLIQAGYYLWLLELPNCPWYLWLHETWFDTIIILTLKVHKEHLFFYLFNSISYSFYFIHVICKINAYSQNHFCLHC